MGDLKFRVQVTIRNWGAGIGKRKSCTSRQRDGGGRGLTAILSMDSKEWRIEGGKRKKEEWKQCWERNLRGTSLGKSLKFQNSLSKIIPIRKEVEGECHGGGTYSQQGYEKGVSVYWEAPLFFTHDTLLTKKAQTLTQPPLAWDSNRASRVKASKRVWHLPLQESGSKFPLRKIQYDIHPERCFLNSHFSTKESWDSNWPQRVYSES